MDSKLSMKALCLIAAASIASIGVRAEPWSFGLMSDTQWKQNLDGENPGTVAAGIARQLNARFISHGVKFVVQVGDLVDVYSDANGRFGYRAQACEDLYAAGIGFFPVRGNHEAGSNAANELPVAFPQTLGAGPHAFGAVNFKSPMPSLAGLSYSFEYNNASFVLIDQFTRKDGGNSKNDTGVVGQIGWIHDVVSSRPAGTHAFVFSHKNLCGGNHADGLFGSSPAKLPDVQNAFYRACAENGVRYFASGHDHMHTRSLMASPDGLWGLEQLITSSNSYKFYIPFVPGNDQRYNVPPRETPISQELFTIGYYIFTVDGPRVTVDYFASPNGCAGDCDLARTPSLSFSKRETFGYSLNGKRFLIGRGENFNAVRDTMRPGSGFSGTRAAILGAINGVTGTFYDGRPSVSEITTGWTAKTELGAGFTSDALTLWGMQDSVGGFSCEPYPLSLSYDPTTKGPHALMMKSGDGSWNHAVDGNTDGTPKFVVGPWKDGYAPGTYGIDPTAKTVWAVINHASEFAVARTADGDQNGDGIVDNADVMIVNSLRDRPASVKPEADLDDDGRITVLDVRKLVLIKN
jgi:hypothetical protein